MKSTKITVVTRKGARIPMTIEVDRYTLKFSTPRLNVVGIPASYYSVFDWSEIENEGKTYINEDGVMILDPNDAGDIGLSRIALALTDESASKIRATVHRIWC